MRTTKIVATMGPATDQPDVLRKLFQSGVNVFRCNASHGTQEDHGRRIDAVRQLSQELGIQAGVLLDLQGPKIRLGTFEGGGCVLETGARFIITTQAVTGTAEKASTTYTEFAKDVKPGDRVLLNDGAAELRVLDTDGVEVTCDVVSGGPIGDRKGINLPGVEVSTPSLTKKDVSDLRFGLEKGVDFVALSFVRKRDDVLRLRVYLEDNDAAIPIVAKIEKPEGFRNLDAILQESDGVMVARGDLGVEMALEKVPAMQKSIIERARQVGKFVITATQMLESMIEHPYPTRAEVSDIANAIYDGTDAVMLSAETSSGKHPVEAARMMARICEETEHSYHPHSTRELSHRENPNEAEIVADAAYRAARSANAKAILVATSSGATARMIARYRPAVPIYAFTPSDNVARQLAVIYGVKPFHIDPVVSLDQMVVEVDRTLVEQKVLLPRDTVIFVAGQPVNRAGSTNLMKVHQVGETR